jgi:hypothetical protein
MQRHLQSGRRIAKGNATSQNGSPPIKASSLCAETMFEIDSDDEISGISPGEGRRGTPEACEENESLAKSEGRGRSVIREQTETDDQLRRLAERAASNAARFRKEERERQHAARGHAAVDDYSSGHARHGKPNTRFSPTKR